MNELQEVHPSHHAYLLLGEREHATPLLYQMLKNNWGITVKGNPDCLIFERENFNIADAREAKRFAVRKAFSGDRKILVLVFSSITAEAQNALLKTLEEPTRGTHFFLIVPMKDILLPTVQSRLYHVRQLHGRDTENVLAESFLNARKAKRLELIADMVKAKDKKAAIGLVNGIEAYLHGKGALPEKAEWEALEETEKVRRYLYDRSPSVKLLLEHLSLIIPSHRSK